MSDSFNEKLYQNYHRRRFSRYYPIEVLQERLAICESCEHREGHGCKKCGCSVYRYRETLLLPQPSCPGGYFKQ